MKKLILVRHAKSDWPEETEDFDRPLADKGLEDAINMSRFLKTNNISIDYLVSSPAVRALNTCEIFNQTYNTSITTNEKLYNPLERNFESVIYDLDDRHDSVAFFSHNNGISNFANSMSKIFSISRPVVLRDLKSIVIRGLSLTVPVRSFYSFMSPEKSSIF